MTVASSTDRTTFLGNGTTTVFSLPFRFFANSDIQAWLVTNATGALTALTLGTHYTLIGAGDPEVDGNPTSKLTMITAPTALQSLFVLRVLPVTQSTDIVNQGRFFPEIHEDVFDRLTMLIQQANGESKGAIRVAIGDPEPSRLPNAVSRANQLMSFDSLGNPVAAAPVSGSATDLALNLANFTDPAKGSAMVGHRGRTLRAKLDEVSVSIVDFGAAVSPFDSSTAFTAALDYLESQPNGGTLYVPPGVWINNNARIINEDNILICGAGARLTTIQRTSAATGYMFLWANDNNTFGGGVIGCRLLGVDTTAAGAGLGFGTAVNYANNFVVDDVICERWGQYGCQVFNGDDWSITRMRVKDHGLTSGAISSCIGFGVFPKLDSRGGYINGVKSTISAECQANASANTAAIKLQTHRDLRASNLYADGGSEVCVSIDSITGYVNNLILLPQGSNSGLSCGNNNPAHIFSGQEFTVDGVLIHGFGSNSMTMTGTDLVHQLSGCTLKNIKCPGGDFRYLNFAAFKDCTFENWDFGGIRMSHASAGTSEPTVVSTGNKLTNIKTNGKSSNGQCAIQVSGSYLEAVGCVKDTDTATGSTTTISGSNNQIVSPVSNGALANNAFAIIGDSNTMYWPVLRDHSARSVSLPAGSDNNVIYGDMKTGTGVSDLGSGNRIIQTPVTSTDKGNAAFTYLPHSSETTLVFATAITADRAVTLSTIGAYAGLKVKVVRKSTATGAFNINVGTGPLKALAAASTWCEVEYDGSAWLLTASGSL